jgi:prepilin-type N-terminal cleavage/methylation domain-containing protein
MKKSKGFTLVEIMIVVLIVALLAAMAIPNLLRTRLSANDAAAQTTLKAISTALENYVSINNVYPPDTTQLIGATPPYVPTDYFTGTHNGFTFSSTLTDDTYLIIATPSSSSLGSRSFTISTGGVLTPQ